MSSVSAIPFTGFPLFYVRDEKANLTAGQTLSAGVWNIRDLNTVLQNDIQGASLSANVVTLPAGTYEFHGEAGGHQCNEHAVRIHNLTTGALIEGVHTRSAAGDYTTTRAVVVGQMTLTASNTIRLEHYTVNAGTGGLAMGRGNEKYADLRIYKLK